LHAGWDKLVEVLDSGGYTRYDFSTASNLLDIMRNLREHYGNLEEIQARADSPRDLEKMLMEFKGVGPVGVNIFLRELRGIWKKADPAPSNLATQVAQKLGLKYVGDFESQLVRLHLEYCKKGACESCPVQTKCKRAGPMRSC
jgi:endonuclease III